jgi:hypothetical protein
MAECGLDFWEVQFSTVAETFLPPDWLLDSSTLVINENKRLFLHGLKDQSAKTITSSVSVQGMSISMSGVGA